MQNVYLSCVGPKCAFNLIKILIFKEFSNVTATGVWRRRGRGHKFLSCSRHLISQCLCSKRVSSGLSDGSRYGWVQITLSHYMAWQLAHLNCWRNHTIDPRWTELTTAGQPQKPEPESKSDTDSAQNLNAQLNVRHYKFYSFCCCRCCCCCCCCCFRSRRKFCVVFLWLPGCRLGFSFMLHFYLFRHLCQVFVNTFLQKKSIRKRTVKVKLFRVQTKSHKSFFAALKRNAECWIFERAKGKELSSNQIVFLCHLHRML